MSEEYNRAIEVFAEKLRQNKHRFKDCVIKSPSFDPYSDLCAQNKLARKLLRETENELKYGMSFNQANCAVWKVFMQEEQEVAG